MVRVMATGVFDLLHLGHVYFLAEAKKLGDELVVVVARDSTARKFKHEPITAEATRVQLVAALKPVDRAVLGHEGGSIYDILEEIKPDVIALGFDQIHTEEKILEECRKRGLRTRVVRLPKFEGDLVGTRKIVRKVAEWLALQERLAQIEGGKAPAGDEAGEMHRRS